MVLIAFVDQFLDRGGLALHPRFADAQDVALHLIHQRIHFAFVIIDPADHLGAGLDHPPQQVFLLHDVQVVAQVGRGWHRVRQAGKVGNAADCFEQLLVLEPLLQRDDVNGLPAVEHLHQRAEDRLVAQVVEHLRAAA